MMGGGSVGLPAIAWGNNVAWNTLSPIPFSDSDWFFYRNVYDGLLDFSPTAMMEGGMSLRHTVNGGVSRERSSNQSSALPS